MADKSEILAAAHVARKAYRAKVLISTLSITLFSTMLVLITVFATGILSEQNGMFEIVSYNSGDGKISLSNTPDFAEPTVRLEGATVDQMTNISGVRDIPPDIDMGEGPHNGESYFAYTFYLRNTGDATIDVEERVDIVGKFKGAEQAIRLRVYRDGEQTTYAASAKDGLSEYGTVAFLSEEVAYSGTVSELAPNETVKYTVVVWLEGDDPECKNDIKGGFVRFAMNFKVINGSDKQAD